MYVTLKQGRRFVSGLVHRCGLDFPAYPIFAEKYVVVVKCKPASIRISLAVGKENLLSRNKNLRRITEATKLKCKALNWISDETKSV